MNNRIKSAIATALVQGALGYALVMTLSVVIPRQTNDKLTTVNVAPKPTPPPPETPPAALEARPALPAPVASVGQPVVLHDWATASPVQRNLDFIKATKWVKDNLPEEDRRLARWREELPQGSGPGRVTRLRPPSLTTHTLYWPAQWSKGLLPIVAWGNGYDGKCSNSSLPYAAFLSEIASHGYFVVAVGNDDIDYPQPEGLEVLADGRPIRTQASALRKAVDWAIAENRRAGSPYAGRLDTGKIAYMGHACGGSQAMASSSDPRATTIVVLNAAARFRPGASDAHKTPLAHFEGSQDDAGVLVAGDANFAGAQAAGWPMYKAALTGVSHDGAYPGPDRRWSKAVLAWLDWQLKGDSNAATALNGLSRHGWSRINATGVTVTGLDKTGQHRTQSVVPDSQPPTGGPDSAGTFEDRAPAPTP